MGCESTKIVAPTNEIIMEHVPTQFDSGRRTTDSEEYDSDPFEDTLLSQQHDDSIENNTRQDDEAIAKFNADKDFIDFSPADPEAFSNSFIQQRQQAIDNSSYRTKIDSWNPNTLQQLVDYIKSLSKGKSLVDCNWFIFYWMARNIKYDIVANLSRKFGDETADTVFRERKGCCGGHANLYKRLCNELNIPSEALCGYVKTSLGNSDGVASEQEHYWSAAEVDGHWYITDMTLVTDLKYEHEVVQRELNTRLFLPRPNEMISHHLPFDDKWQLLQQPIQRSQFTQMPDYQPAYFELNLTLINPRDQKNVSLIPGKSYGMVLIGASSDILLLSNIKLNNITVDGYSYTVYDTRKQLYRCYFAPVNVGRHEIIILARKRNAENNSYSSAFSLCFDVNEMPKTAISFPNRSDSFFDLGLQIFYPRNTNTIKIDNGSNHTQILIRAPNDVLLYGDLKNSDKQVIEGGNRVYYDRRKNIWRCKFAPNQNGTFEAMICAKTNSNPEYTWVVSFNIDAKNIPTPPLSYPFTSQLFHDFNLKIKSPVGCSKIVLPNNASYAEIYMRVPDDVQILGSISQNDKTVDCGSITQFNDNTNLWQILFAPQCNGLHDLFVFGKHNSNTESMFDRIVKFQLMVPQLHRSITFPFVSTEFSTNKCRLYEPLNGVLKKGSIVLFHMMIPGATDICVQVDSQWPSDEHSNNPYIKKQVTVGSKDVTISAKFEQNTNYHLILKYSVK